MEKKMLINAAEPEECRIAVTADGKLDFFDGSSIDRAQYKGNIYKGQIVRIEPSLQAAFVEFAPDRRAGFLAMSEIMPELWVNQPEDEDHRARPRIEDVVKKRQDIIVQVVKEEQGKKGAALTSFLSLAGRYLVLMPGNESGGISRKIEDEDQRAKLKKMVSELKLPDTMGIIVRTAGLGRTKTELSRDLQAQMRLWKEIEHKAAAAKSPALLYQEQDVLIRTLRDYFTTDITEIICDTPGAFDRALTFVKSTMPRMASRVAMYEASEPLFSHYKVEEQIEALASNRVNLPSGGWIVLEQTEAMVSVDVNSGRATQEKGIEKTALRTNVEAAEETARQLRLRDMGGLVVIDFIDMKDTKNAREVEKTLRSAFKSDRARIEIGKVSKFGLVELSRQRLKASFNGQHVACPRCRGTGSVQKPEAEALQVLRMLKAHCGRGTVSSIRLNVPVSVADFLLNQKRWILSELEGSYHVSISIIPDPHLDSVAFAPAPEMTRRAQPIPDTIHPPVLRQAPPVPLDAPLDGPADDVEVPADQPLEAPRPAPEAVAPSAQPAPGYSGAPAPRPEGGTDDGFGGGRRRRRRRRRGRDRFGRDGDAFPSPDRSVGAPAQQQQPAQSLPRRITDDAHRAPVDAIGEGTPLPPGHEEFGVEPPPAVVAEAGRRPAEEPTPSRYDSGQPRNDSQPRGDHQPRHDRHDRRDRFDRGGRGGGGRDRFDRGGRGGRDRFDRRPRSGGGGGDRFSQQPQPRGFGGPPGGGGGRRLPAGLPRDEDLIHPDDLANPHAHDEQPKPKVLAAPLMEAPPRMPKGYTLMRADVDASEEVQPSPDEVRRAAGLDTPVEPPPSRQERPSYEEPPRRPAPADDDHQPTPDDVRRAEGRVDAEPRPVGPSIAASVPPEDEAEGEGAEAKPRRKRAPRAPRAAGAKPAAPRRPRRAKAAAPVDEGEPAGQAEPEGGSEGDGQPGGA